MFPSIPTPIRTRSKAVKQGCINVRVGWGLWVEASLSCALRQQQSSGEGRGGDFSVSQHPVLCDPTCKSPLPQLLFLFPQYSLPPISTLFSPVLKATLFPRYSKALLLTLRTLVLATPGCPDLDSDSESLKGLERCPVVGSTCCANVRSRV